MSETQKHTKPNVPNLRFPGFEGEWEKQSLGEVGEPFIGLTYSPSDVVSEGGVIVFRSSNIQNGEIDYSDIVRVNKKLKESIVTRKDDLVICARNGSPRLIGKNALLKESDANQTFGAFMLVYRSPENHFIHQLLSTKRYYSQVSENLGARINQITTANIKDFEFFFPKGKDERDKISKFLDFIDQRIAFQNRVIEDLKKLKAALCESLYDESEPNYLIGEIIEQTSTRNRNGESLRVLSVSNQFGFIDQSEQFEGRTIASQDTSNYKIVSRDDFVYNPARINVGSIARLKCLEKGIVSPMYVCFHCKEGVLPGYLESFFDTDYFFSEMEKRLEGSVRMCLSYEGLCNIPIAIPDMQEQMSIGLKIQVLKDKIILEEAVCKHMHLQKQYLLYQLFI